MTLDIIKNKTWMMITFILGGIILTSAISSNKNNPVLPVEVSDPFLGEVSIFTGDFPPKGWAFCDGQLLAVASNQELFSLLGTTYGGDGNTSFALPDLRGRVAIHTDKTKNGPGTDHVFGEKGGSEIVDGMAKQIAKPLAGETGVYITEFNNNTRINNRQPSLGIRYIIAIDPAFRLPSRT